MQPFTLKCDNQATLQLTFTRFVETKFCVIVVLAVVLLFLLSLLKHFRKQSYNVLYNKNK